MGIREAAESVKAAAAATREKLSGVNLYKESSSTELIIRVNPITSELPSVGKAANEVMQNAIAEAYNLYLRYVPIARIEKITGIPIDELKSYVYGADGWKKKREEFHKEINEEIKQTHLAKLKQVTGVGISLIGGALEAVQELCQKEGRALDLEGARLVADIFSKLHKAKMLEEASDVGSKMQSLSPMQVLKAFADDPYLQISMEESRVQDVNDEVLEQTDESGSFKRKSNADPDSLADSNRS